jgi:hypothetical protein
MNNPDTRETQETEDVLRSIDTVAVVTHDGKEFPIGSTLLIGRDLSLSEATRLVAIQAAKKSPEEVQPPELEAPVEPPPPDGYPDGDLPPAMEAEAERVETEPVASEAEGAGPAPSVDAAKPARASKGPR